jgi:hypothetical protein
VGTRLDGHARTVASADACLAGVGIQHTPKDLRLVGNHANRASLRIGESTLDPPAPTHLER